ncbi:MAG: tryptophan-rich sensory protein [Bosea sp.]|jgi:tryptophan-rich sensory protein|nr:tryptophan-rich sensory protein [Bosea sp. (in: a-proteobacteria)]
MATLRFPLDKLLYAVVPIVLCSFLGNFATQPAIPGWYAGLVKPSFNPPNWLFPVAWTTLFTLMAYSVFRVWKIPADRQGRNAALVIFHVQLAVNCSWSFAFFGARSPLLGLVVIVPFLALIVLTIQRFAVVDRLASRLLWPYAGWVAFATVLNLSIWWLNRSAGSA